MSSSCVVINNWNEQQKNPNVSSFKSFEESLRSKLQRHPSDDAVLEWRFILRM